MTKYDTIHPDKLTVSDLNERKHDTEPDDAMVDDVRKNGVEEPIEVRPADDDSDALYEIIAGQRRWNAAILAGLSEVPIKILDDVSDKDARRMSIRENFRSSNFSNDASPGDRARAIFELWQDDMGGSGTPSPTKVSNEINTSKATVNDWIEPLRSEWKGTPVDPRSYDGHTEEVDTGISIESVGTRTLSEIRRLDASDENRIELVRLVAKGEETRRTIQNLKDSDVDAYLSEDSYDGHTEEQEQSEEVDTGINLDDSYDGHTDDDSGTDYYGQFCEIVEQYNEEQDAHKQTSPEVIGDAVGLIVQEQLENN